MNRMRRLFIIHDGSHPTIVEEDRPGGNSKDGRNRPSSRRYIYK